MVKETIMVFCAHPDDEAFGLGATIAKYAKEGHDVFNVIFSYGEQGNWWLRKKHTIETRVKEAIKGDKILGCKKTYFLGVPDLKIKEEIKKRKIYLRVAALIKKHKPNKIFTHVDDDMYPDHRAVREIVIKTIGILKYKCDVYSFDVWSPVKLSTNYPKLVIDVSKTFKIKVKALREFKSQGFVMLQLLPAVYWRAIKNGWKAGVKRAEVFYKIK